MIKAQKPENEIQRLEALVRYNILDTPPEIEYDEISQLAATLCGTPVAMISFIDENRKWYKSRVGTESTFMDRDVAVCSHTIIDPSDLVIIEDTRKDSRFEDSPITKSKSPTIFYAGVKLIDTEGYALGTLCVVDHKPGKLSEIQANSLALLGRQVMRLLEHRRNSVVLDEIRNRQKNSYKELEQFTHVLAHDVVSPMATIEGLSSLVLNDLTSNPDAVEGHVANIQKSAKTIRSFVTDLLGYFKSDNLVSSNIQKTSIQAVLEHVVSMIDPDKRHIFTCDDSQIIIKPLVLEHVLLNLFTNAIKYNDNSAAYIHVGFKESSESYEFHVKDNGRGVPKEIAPNIFKLLVTSDESGGGSGIGLAIVKKLVEKEGGAIKLQETGEGGSTFKFSIRKVQD